MADLLLALGLAVISYTVGVRYLRDALTAGLKPEFYQYEFGPAVMLACGHGFVAPAEGGNAALDQFLNVERDSLQCADLPANAALRPLTRVQAVSRYLMGTVAAIWAIGGLSWSRLVLLSGVLFATTVMLAFLLARLLAGRITSTIVAMALMLSPLHWSQLAHLRDYAKAPLMMALVWLLVLLVRAPQRPKWVAALAAAFGVVLGIGFGFRSDLIIVVPMFVVAVIGFVPGGVFRHLKLKAGALALAALGFMAAAWPLFGIYGEGGGLQVVALLGFVTPFDRALEVEPGPYEFGTKYSDWYMGAIIRDFGRRTLGNSAPIPLYRSAYNAAGSGVIRELVKTVPADILVRAYASVISIARLPASSWTDSHWPAHIRQGSLAERVLQRRARVLEHLGWVWPAAVAAALIVGSALDLRLAVFATILLLYFGGYPAIQFHERHMFHLDVVPLLALAFLCGQARRLSRWRPRATGGLRPLMTPLARPAAFVAVLLLFLVLPLGQLRAYQTSQLRTTLAARLAAPQEPIPLTARPLDGGRVIFETGTLLAQRAAESAPGVVTSEYLVAHLGGPRCDALRVPLTLRYHAPFPRGDLSTTTLIHLPLDATGRVQLLTPAFYRYRPESDLTDFTDRSSHYQFRGFEVEAATADCVEGATRIVDPGPFPLLLSATLAPGWHDATLYQTLGTLERRHDVDRLNAVSAPADLHVSRRMLSAPLRPLDIEARAEALHDLNGGGWTMDGPGGIGGSRGPFTYLLTARAGPIRLGDQLIVEGVLRSGGLSVGVIRDDRWLAQTGVTAPGRFLAVVQVPSDGVSTVVIANNLPYGVRSNHLDITRAGWLEAIARP